MKKKTNAQLKKELWKVFSEFIRKRDMFTCFTCGRIGTSSGIHAGHFISKAVGGLSLYFNEDNVHAQCYHCNINLGGNSYVYGKRLGDKAEKLYLLKQKIVKDYPFLQKIEEYKKKIKDLDESRTH